MVLRMEHVGIVVEEMAPAIEFFLALGLELQAQWSAEDEWVGRVIGLDGVRAEAAMLGAPGGSGAVELVSFHSPPSPAGDPGAPSNAPGIRHLSFAVEDLDATLARCGAEPVGAIERYEDSWRLCYVRGPGGILIELAEPLGSG